MTLAWSNRLLFYILPHTPEKVLISSEGSNLCYNSVVTLKTWFTIVQQLNMQLHLCLFHMLFHKVNCLWLCCHPMAIILITLDFLCILQMSFLSFLTLRSCIIPARSTLRLGKKYSLWPSNIKIYHIILLISTFRHAVKIFSGAKCLVSSAIWSSLSVVIDPSSFRPGIEVQTHTSKSSVEVLRLKTRQFIKQII